MKKIISLTIAIFICAFSFGQDIKKWKINDLENFIKESQKPTIINFWATWCKPCIEELPYFQSLSKKYAKDSVQLLLVSLDMAEAYPKTLNNFIQKKKSNSSCSFFR